MELPAEQRAFETWVKSSGLKLPLSKPAHRAGYNHSRTQSAWRAYQAGVAQSSELKEAREILLGIVAHFVSHSRATNVGRVQTIEDAYDEYSKILLATEKKSTLASAFAYAARVWRSIATELSNRLDGLNSGRYSALTRTEQEAQKSLVVHLQARIGQTARCTYYEDIIDLMAPVWEAEDRNSKPETS